MNTTPETMTKHDFSDLTPPDALVHELIELLRERVGFINDGCLEEMIATAYRAGAEQAAERLKGQWPEPITDRAPTEADGDEYGLVQCLDRSGHWHAYKWNLTLKGQNWLHTPRWQPPAPPTLKELALKVLEGTDALEQPLTERDRDLIIRALEADS